ncbi:MAG: heme exporter protein CcmB [Deltaproteobacteria bacterium]|nr:heme exporter protein CcmB [Deltaproteobacteria bacterium]MBI4373924.1 heme exporter protein CcmB [Deltaproteobacteria bacterium]
MTLLPQTGWLLSKEMRVEFRELYHLLSLFMFALLLLILLSFALGNNPDLMKKVAPGLFWIAIFFSSTLTLNSSFRRETEDGQWEGLLLLGIDPKALYLGKFLANLIFLLTLQIILVPFWIVFFDLSFTFSLLSILFLGSIGISTIGTFYAGLVASFREGPVFLPLLLFPMLVPVLLASVQATQYLITQDPFGQQIVWVRLLIAFDIIFFLGSLSLADFLFEEPQGGK